MPAIKTKKPGHERPSTRCANHLYNTIFEELRPHDHHVPREDLMQRLEAGGLSDGQARYRIHLWKREGRIEQVGPLGLLKLAPHTRTRSRKKTPVRKPAAETRAPGTPAGPQAPIPSEFANPTMFAAGTGEMRGPDEESMERVVRLITPFVAPILRLVADMVEFLQKASKP
jgi:hypothetical protein